jgi:hypothetical protein
MNFEETQIYLKLERTSIPTSRRSKSKEVSHVVKKTTTVLDIKVEVSHSPVPRRPPHISRLQSETFPRQLISDYASNEYNANQSHTVPQWS